jgi:hypothetical protein
MAEETVAIGERDSLPRSRMEKEDLMTDSLDAAIAAMTSEQIQELNACVRQLAKELVPRLPRAIRREHKQGFDEIRADLRLGDSPSELHRKALALDILTRIVCRCGGLRSDDPMGPIFIRSMEALSQLGLAERSEVDPASEEGEELRQLLALQEAPVASETLN